MSHRTVRKAGLVFLAVALLSLAFPAASPAQNKIDLTVHYVDGAPLPDRLAYDVSAFFSALDASGDPIKDLQAQNVTVSEDSKSYPVDSLVLASDEPINIVLVLDTSGTMVGGKITDARKAADAFVARLNPQDRVAVITFNQNVATVIDFSTDHTVVRQQIASVEAVPNAGTCLYDAAYQAAQMTASLPQGRRSIILLTDGMDETASGGVCSTFTLDDVTDIATRGSLRVPIYTIGLGNRIDEAGLTRFAALTGGRYQYSPDSSKLDALFARLSEQLRVQYVLHYTSNSAPGAHTIAVRVDYLGAQDQDTRDFILPVLPWRITFLSPVEGAQVSGKLKLSVSLSGQGDPVQRVAFLAGEKILGTDDSTPYELDIDSATYPNGALTFSAIAQGANEKELARASVTVNHVTATPAVEAPKDLDMWLNSPWLIFGLGGLLLLVMIVFGVYLARRRADEKRALAWAQAQSASESVYTESYTLDAIATGSDTRAVFIVKESDDPAMISKRLLMNQAIIHLGRGGDNELPFPKDSPVSRHHAIVEEKQGGLYLREALTKDSSGAEKGPMYGTFVNDEQISGEVALQDSDRIRLGKRLIIELEIIEHLRFDSTKEDIDKTVEQGNDPDSTLEES
ncbi:MAG: VWA domain-containing protein [Anaerolineales bacterium]|nr:VWA domain-containing protein [Anaerolineales bacterium]